MAEPVAEPKALPEPEKKKEQSLPFLQLFAFADKYDWFLMTLGSLGAVVHGSSMPVFFLLFGEMVNGFGKNQFNFHKMTSEVTKVLISSQILCFMILVFYRSQIRLFYSVLSICSMLCILCTWVSLSVSHPTPVSKKLLCFPFREPKKQSI